MHNNLDSIGSLGYQYWFTLDNSLSRWKRPVFKIQNSRNSQISVWKPSFFLGKLGGPFFLQYNLDSIGSLGYQFGSLWTTPWPDEKDLFLKFVNNFFPRQAIAIFFDLDSRYTGDTPYQVWFDLDNSSTSWKRPIFENYSKFIIRINRKLPYENLDFFLRKL